MEHPGFFEKAGPFQPKQICEALAIDVPSNVSETLTISDIKPLTLAGATDLSFFENRKFINAFKATNAALCLVTERYAKEMPHGVTPLIVGAPHEEFAKLIRLFYPHSIRSRTSMSNLSPIDESAVIEEDVEIEPGAIIGKEAHIGAGTRIAAGSVIGYRVHIGRGCTIGPNVTLIHSLMGNNVTIHAGAAIGQDGFGYLMGAKGHQKVPQIGRVILQDDVEVGANTTIDRGALADTIIGEGTKIDNLVQIAHNVVIGRHAVIVSQTGISGSTVLGDFVVMGGQTGAVGHIEIGAGAQIAAASNVHKSVPAGARYGGTPAKSMRKWFREIIVLERLAEASEKKKKA